MKSIDVADIREGDLIRVEFEEAAPGVVRALEYVAVHDRDILSRECRYYLLEREFKPTWGMVIGNPVSNAERAVFLPDHSQDTLPWLMGGAWGSNAWAEGKIKEGWEIIEKPEWAE